MRGKNEIHLGGKKEAATNANETGGISRRAQNHATTPKRCTIELTPGAKSEVDRIRKTFKLTMSDVFRFALLLMRIYSDTILKRKELHIVDPKDPRVVRIIELPLFCAEVESRKKDDT